MVLFNQRKEDNFSCFMLWRFDAVMRGNLLFFTKQAAPSLTLVRLVDRWDRA